MCSLISGRKGVNGKMLKIGNTQEIEFVEAEKNADGHK